jgi:vacuolar protein sorting-associated protein 26
MKSLFGSSQQKSKTQNDEIKLEIIQPPDNEKYRLPYFYPGSIILLKTDVIEGSVGIPLIGGKPYKHNGIRISVVGQNRVKSDNTLSVFYKRSKMIVKEGEVNEPLRLTFRINPIDFVVPSFYGTFTDSRYIIQARINVGNTEYNTSVPVYVLFTEPVPDKITPLKAEVGIQNVLHVEFVIQNPIFDCGGVIIGKVNFLVVKIRIVNMYLQIRRTEYFNNGIISYRNEAIIAQYEILDGMPVRGDTVPIRFYLPSVKVWPYPKSSGRNLEVKYNIRLFLLDENGKHYFKDLSDTVTRLEIQ